MKQPDLDTSDKDSASCSSSKLKYLNFKNLRLSEEVQGFKHNNQQARQFLMIFGFKTFAKFTEAKGMYD